MCHNLAYVVASWSFPPIDRSRDRGVALDSETVVVADARLDDRSSLATSLSRSLHCEVPLRPATHRCFFTPGGRGAKACGDAFSATTHSSWLTSERDGFLPPGRIPAGAHSSTRSVALGCSLPAIWMPLRAIPRCRNAHAMQRYPPFWHSEIPAVETPAAQHSHDKKSVIRGRSGLRSGGRERELPPIWLWEHYSSPDPSPESREVPKQFFDLVKEATRDRCGRPTPRSC